MYDQYLKAYIGYTTHLKPDLENNSYGSDDLIATALGVKSAIAQTLMSKSMFEHEFKLLKGTGPTAAEMIAAKPVVELEG